MAITHILRQKDDYYQIDVSKTAWALKFDDNLSKEKKLIQRNWKDYFLQRNLTYFFNLEDIKNGEYNNYERGLSCYANCALALDENIHKELIRIPGQLSLLYVTPLDLKTERFDDVFARVNEILDEQKLRINGNPWGNLGYRDEKFNDAITHIFLWIPVEIK